MSGKGKFGGDAYKPKQLGPEPANPTSGDAPPSQPTPSTSDANAATMAALRAVKVPFSSRITVAADQQLKAMAREGRSQTDLLAEALNLLFKKHGRDQVA
jgi:hypothetical protein